MNVKLLKLKNGGIFFNVNKVIDFIYRAKKENYKFVIDWGDSCYKDGSMEGDPWNYYFEDCFEPVSKYNIHNLKIANRPGFRPENNIIRPHTGEYLLLPKNRYLVHQYISKYIKLKPHLTKIINEFKKENFNEHIIGLHLRGPGRIDGGVPKLREKYNLKNDVPFDLYFKCVDTQLKKHPEAKILLCSDSQMVINECKNKYKDKIIIYKASRSEYGEMHNNIHQNAKDANKGLTFSNYKLGEDVIVEAYLLSAANFLIHGNSNVSNFVLCNNPNLYHTYVFKKDDRKRNLFIKFRIIKFKCDELSTKLKKHSKIYSKFINLAKGRSK